MQKKTKRRRKRKNTPPLLREVVAIILIVLAITLGISLGSQAEGMGIFGLALRGTFVGVFGVKGSVLFTAVLAVFALRLFFGRNFSIGRWELPCGVLCFLVVITAWQLFDGPLPISAWLNQTTGGFVGNALVWTLSSVFGPVGSWVILGGLFLVALLGLTNVSLASLLQRIWSLFVSAIVSTYEGQDKRREKRAAKGFRPAELTIQDYAAGGKGENETETAAEAEARAVVEQPAVWKDIDRQQQSDAQAVDWQVEQLPLPSDDQAAYQLPPLSLLNRPFRPRSTKQNQDIYDNSQTLENTLENFGIKARVIQAIKGPAVTRYEIQTAPGTKVSRVTSLADDIALSLACSEVRIEAPIPGKAAIGIEVPNKSVSPVLLRDVLESSQFADASEVLTVGLGKDIAGQAIVANLAEMPHLLIAGATGSGKSVCINAMIASLLYKATPKAVRFLMIDPKVVELASYNGIPHLLAPVVNNPKKAAVALKWATGEMERRYGSFAKAGVRDIARFNEWAEQSGKETLPHIVVIIDELADLMMVARADVEDAICRLAQMARACGMHLVIGTQRPSTDVITGLIKANIPSRISFAVSSATDSRVILDIGGAEKLLGKGDMLFAPVGVGKPLRVQGAFVSNREIEKLVEFVGNQSEAQYVEQLCRIEETGPTGPEDDRDELFVQAANVVVDAGQASVSLLQRRLRVGYTRAARIVDQLESAGIVGPYEGSKPRQVFKNREIVKSLIEAGKRTQTM